jgi:hypothetical protein
MIGFIAPYRFTRFGTIGNYSSIVILHTFQFTAAHALGFSLFTSRILTTVCNCNFKSHMESSCHNLIPFLGLILQLTIPKTQLNSIPSPYRGRLASRSSILHFRLGYSAHITQCDLLCSFINPLPFSIIKEACLQFCCLPIDAQLLNAFVARMCLPSRCLTMGIHITILIRVEDER